MSLALTVRREPDGPAVRLKGRVAWAMQHLINKGAAGISVFDTPCPRMSDYIFKIRGHGFPVETVTEHHGGQFPGHHARYRLQADVSIVEAAGGAQ